MGGGVFELGNPEEREAQAVLEIQVNGGLKKPCLRRGGVNFFWNNPLQLRGSMGSKGWRSGESAHLPPMWPAFKS